MPIRDYLFFELTNSICSRCLEKVEAKVIFQDGKVFLWKECFEHGPEKVLIATDIEYFKRIRSYVKAGEMPIKFNTRTEYGCPYDCGLCPGHEQHSCLTLVEITDRCNLTCPTCYAESGPLHGRHRTLEEVEAMLDIIVANEGKPDIVQLSGGEPTIHPQFFEILARAKKKPIRHLMVNTNGVRIAKDPDFARRLQDFTPGLELYLQFDSFEEKALRTLRGEDLREVRLKALERLNELNISTTLVVTVQNGLNNHEIGKIIEFGLRQRCVRGVTFQPVQVAGRLEGFDPARDRYTLTQIRSDILAQTDIFRPDDLVPVPCNPDSLAMAYALKIDGKVHPLTRHINPDDLLNASKNTIVYEQDKLLREKAISLFSTANSPEAAGLKLQSLLCCLPGIAAPALSYENVFRVIIMQFLDRYNFDVRVAKKSCVHIVNKDGKIIPFDTMNLFYRDGHESKLAAIRNRIRPQAAHAT
jgi:uncharacterized radical SAM superfamily Fe-S cluster-containing enzyme